MTNNGEYNAEGDSLHVKADVDTPIGTTGWSVWDGSDWSSAYTVSVVQNYACVKGTGTGCKTCVPQAERLSDASCATCNAGYKLDDLTCRASSYNLIAHWGPLQGIAL